MEELEASCRKCVRMEVSSTKALACVLDDMNIEYKILSETSADVYAKVNMSKLILALDRVNCDVISANERNESLESYYISLVGGDQDA